MLRILCASALALAVGGAAMAQQASGTADAAMDAAADPAAPAPDVKGVYSTKRVMGISTGQADDEEDESAEADAADEGGASATQ